MGRRLWIEIISLTKEVLYGTSLLWHLQLLTIKRDIRAVIVNTKTRISEYNTEHLTNKIQEINVEFRTKSPTRIYSHRI